MYLREKEKRTLINWFLGFLLFAILLFIWMDIANKAIVKYAPSSEPNCKRKLVPLSNDNIFTSVFPDCQTIEVRIERDRDPNKREYICTLNISTINIKTDSLGNYESMFYNVYSLDHHGKDIILEFLFLEESDFDFFSKNIGIGFLGLSVLDN